MHWILDRPQDNPQDWVYATVARGGRSFTRVGDCPHCGRGLLQERAVPLVLDLHGTDLSGFVWTDTADVALEASLVTQLEDAHLKGITYLPADAEAWWRPDLPSRQIVNWLEREAPPLLKMLLILGRAKALPPTGRPDVRCVVCGRLPPSKLGGGFRVDPATWDQSDILHVEEYPAIPVVSERFVEALQTLGVRNYALIPTDGFVPSLAAC